jgi:tRNA(Ile)-lysidine synthase
MHKLTETVRSTIVRHRMVVPGGTVVAAVSGGPDSMAMLHVLKELSPQLGICLAVAHLDHGFRPEAAEESRFVAAEAERLGLPFVSEEAGLKESLKENPENKQAAARNARYSFLERAADRLGAGRIAVGHTADDQAETWLMREIRGSGASGLSSIPPVRGRVIRPLIDASREDIMDYLAQKGVQSITDQSNLQPVYLRNRVRLDYPLLKNTTLR